MNQLQKTGRGPKPIKKHRGILTCIGEFRPGNKTIYVVFDEESEFLGPRTPKFSPGQVFQENVPYKKLKFEVF